MDLTKAQAEMQQALALHQSGRLAEAKAIYQTLLDRVPDDPDILRLLGMAEYRLGHVSEGMRLLEKSLQINPNQPAGYNNYGLLLQNLNRPQDALMQFDRALALNPGYAVAHNNRGNALTALKRLGEAVASFDRALALEPNYAEAHYNRGIALHDLERFEEAISSFDRALLLEPNSVETLVNRGIALQELHRLEEAVASYEQAIALRADHAEAYGNRGNALHDLQQYDAALASYEQAIALKPDYAEAYNNRGNTLVKLKRHDAALASFEQALALKRDYTEAFNNRGNALAQLKRYEAALASYRQAIAVNPNYAKAYYNCGIVLMNLKQFEPALANYEQALILEPEYAEACFEAGNALAELKRHDAALASFHKAIELKPDYADAYSSRGNTLLELKQYAAARESYRQALSLKPDLDLVPGQLLYTRMLICDWEDLEAELSGLLDKISRGESATQPFIPLAFTSDLAIQRKSAEIGAEKFPEQTALGPIARHGRGNKIRIGYFSADFRNHPVSILLAELFELHDRSRFELIGFSFGQDDQSELRRRIKKSFRKFFDVGDKSDREVAELARKLGIDIAVDLGGYTDNNRAVGAFAFRAAPIQVNYLGYSATMGTKCHDYIIADEILIPPDSRPFYSESVVYLPDTYMANDRKREIPDKTPTREEMGLPASGFVFCSFNNAYKINPRMFDIWMRLLQRVEGSVLWLAEANPLAVDNLFKEAANRGVAAERLVFARRLPSLADHLARHRLADLFLDTVPYNGHTTAADALWAGLPVLTQAEESFASRVAASLLNAIGLPELVTTTREEYEALAVALATHPDRLARLRQKLAQNRLSMPLFDTPLFTRHIEAAYLQMHARHLADLPPAHLRVAKQESPTPKR